MAATASTMKDKDAMIVGFLRTMAEDIEQGRRTVMAFKTWRQLGWTGNGMVELQWCEERPKKEGV